MMADHCTANTALIMNKRIFDTIIIGGGLSGLTLAHRILCDQPQHNFCVLEAKNTSGGVIQSVQHDDILAEPGPHGFLDNCIQSQQLLQETGLDKIALTASLKTFVRYVYHEGQLKMIAQSPGKILTAPLISPFAKLGVLRDIYKPCLEGEPSIAQWGAYRFGTALLPYLDAAFTGTYAGDIEKLSIDGVMPGLRAVEREYGSIIRGLLKKRKKSRKQRGKKRPGLPAMTSFPGGMCQLTETLTAELTEGKNLFYNSLVQAICREEGEGWRVTTESGEYIAANLVLAVPVNTALALLVSADGLTAEPPLPELPQAAISTIAMTFSGKVDIPPGFGFLVPEQEKKFILGAMFSSNMFSGRAPQGTHLLEVMVGGRRHPERLEKDDAALIAAAIADIQEILQIRETPLSALRLPSAGAFPQAEKGYTTLMHWKEEIEAATSGLFLCGFGWQGIGINDMIKGSFQVAERLLCGEQQKKGSEIKGIYF